MKKPQSAEASIASFALLLALAVVPEPLAASLKLNSVSAQSASDAPASTDSNQTVRIDGSPSMKVTNEIRKQQLERRSPGTDVRVNYNGTDAALRSVLNGGTDLAAVGRPLTAEEKQGLGVAPENRHKIAIVVGPENPFRGNLTFDQFAKIFRGEITDWSQVGGPAGRIQLIDHPETSDTRRALQSYSVFRQAPFVAAANAVKLPQDSTDAMIQRLGTRGIGYAIADQVRNTPGVRIVSMHKTLPSDPRYPYSQPLAYAYKQPPSPAVAAFLGDVTAAASPQGAAATAPTAPQAAVPAAPAAPQAAAPASPETAIAPAQATEERGFPWWLLLIPLLGGLLWWLLKRPRPAATIAPVAAPKVVPVPPAAPAASVAAASVASVPPTAPVVPVAPVILDEQSPSITLHEERLVADKLRQKVGDVAVGKQVKTEQAQISVPVEKDRVVIERVTPANGGTVLSGDVAFGAEEARIETYEEMPEIRKEAFLREEVNIRKEVDRETVKAEETLRREELDIRTEGHPAVDDRNRPNNSSR